MTVERLRDQQRVDTYVAAAQPVFDAVHETSTRLAGLLMAFEMLKSRHALDAESRIAARARFEDARAGIDRLAPPLAAEHFHHHLAGAVAKLEVCLEALESKLAGLISSPDPLPPLRAAWRDIEAASLAMPGFETVDFQQSCCALHIKLPNRGGQYGRIFNLDS